MYAFGFDKYVRGVEGCPYAPYVRIVGMGVTHVLYRSSQIVPVDVQSVMEPPPGGHGGGVYVTVSVISWHL